jgi:translocation and assembly module TamB
MKRWVLTGLILVLFLGLSSWGCYYFFRTPKGVRWLFKAVSLLSPLTLSAEKIEGRIAGPLYLEGVRADWTDGHLRVQKIRTRLNLFHLLRGKIVFEEITGFGIILDDQRKRAVPLDLSLPRVSGLPARIGMEVLSFNLKEIHYRSPGDRPRIIEVIRGRLAWRQGILAVSPLLVKGDLGRLEGALSVGFSMPAIGLNILWVPEKPWQGLEQIVIQGQLRPSWRGEDLAGPIFIKGRTKTSDRYLLRAELGVTPHRFNFRKVSFKEAGRKGSINGQGMVLFDRIGPAFQALLTLEDLDLSQEASTAISLSGQLRLTGRPGEYTGSFDLKNKVRSWQSFRLAGTLQGKQAGLEIKVDQGEWLKGSIQGLVGIRLDKEISIHGFLKGRQLRSEVIHPQWAGLINLDAQGAFSRSLSGLNRGTLALNLLESRFQEKNLQGEIKVSLEKNSLFFDRAELQGRGFKFSGRGILSERFDFETQVSDLSSLVPNSRGSVSAAGWVRWRKGLLGTRLTLKGNGLDWRGTRCRELILEASIDSGKSDTAMDLKARIRELDSPYFTAHSLSGEAMGTWSRHQINLALQGSDGKIEAGLSGSYREKHWKGVVRSLSLAISQGNPLSLQSPASLEIGPDRLQLSTMILAGKFEERISLKADLGLKPVTGIFSAEWRNIDLARSRPFLEKVRITGQTTGWARATFFKNDRLDLQTSAELTGVFRSGKQRVELTRGGLKVSWDEQGLRSSWNLETKDGGRIRGEATSPEKGRFAFPDQGKLEVAGEGLDLDLFYPGKTPGVQARGKIGGRVQGGWTSGPRLTLKGRLELTKGSLTWQEKGAVFNARVNKAEAGILWAEDNLSGDLNLELEDYGKISGDFKLPLPALIPVKIKSDGPIELNLAGKVGERGLLTALFPEAVQTSRGKIQGNLSVRGTWEKPSLEGDLELTEGGADLLPLGIRIRNVSAKATFNRDRINLSALEMQSGQGRLNGRGVFWLKDWKIDRIEGKLTGNNFQIINRPGIVAQASPLLDISGRPGHLILTGVLEIPEALFSSAPSGGFKRASPDVVIIDPRPSSQPGTAWPIYGEIRLLLGQQVRMKAGGLDAFLQGEVSVSLKGTQSINAQGEIKVARGHFLLQNRKLEITRGRFNFNGRPENPTLDLLALRSIPGKKGLQEWVEEVEAGIAVTGTLQSSQVKLYSRPMMPESDILSYILFGEPLKKGAGKQDLALLSKAAKVLMGGNLQGKLAGLLSLDTVEIQSDNADFYRSVITVGKYLDPRLFLGLGGSLFDNSYQVILRYALTPNLEIETRGGTHSSGGIFFKIDFE